MINSAGHQHAPHTGLAYTILDLARRYRLDMIAYAGRIIDPELGHFPGDEVDDVTTPIGLTDLTTDCGTTACYAGWTVAYAGYRIDSYNCVYQGSERLSVRGDALAAQLLGITVDQADYLFLCSDEQLEGRVAEVFGPRPERTPVTEPEGADHG